MEELRIPVRVVASLEIASDRVTRKVASIRELDSSSKGRCDLNERAESMEAPSAGKTLSSTVNP